MFTSRSILEQVPKSSGCFGQILAVRCRPILSTLAAAGILQPNGQAYPPDELEFWWQNNWLRAYTQLQQKQEATDSCGAAYEQDFRWCEAWTSGSQRVSFWFTRCSPQSVSPVFPATVRRLVARPEAF
jgi:hypothetical protein